jgi:hypothetical protein
VLPLGRRRPNHELGPDRARTTELQDAPLVGCSDCWRADGISIASSYGNQPDAHDNFTVANPDRLSMASMSADLRGVSIRHR